MKKVYHAHKETYGKAYGIAVILALLFFFIVGASWFGISLYLGSFNIYAFIMTVVFAVQVFLRRKIVNVILGIITLFFSLWQLFEVVTFYPMVQDAKGLYSNVFIIGMIVFAVAIIMSFILIFSFLRAFKKQENL